MHSRTGASVAILGRLVHASERETRTNKPVVDSEPIRSCRKGEGRFEVRQKCGTSLL